MGKLDSTHRKLVLVPCPLQGYIDQMLHLATILASKGFSVTTIIHSQFNSNPSSDHFNILCLPNAAHVSQLLLQSGNSLQLLNSLNANYRAPLHDLLAQMAARGEILCVVYDTHMHCVDDVANNLKLPSIAFCSTSAIHTMALQTCIQLEKQGCLPLKDSDSLDLVPGFHPLRFKDLPFFNCENLQDFLRQVTSQISIRFPSAIIHNTFDFLEKSSIRKHQQCYGIPTFALGPLHKFETTQNSVRKEDEDINIICMSWLDKQKPKSVLYINLGINLSSMDKNELTELVWGLANSEQPFLWGDISDTELIELLPQDFVMRVRDRSCFTKKLPQKEVFAHGAIGGFWSRGDWNWTLESVCAGIPMICWPSSWEQSVHARYMTLVWGLAIQFENKLERSETERFIRTLIVSGEGEKLRSRAIEIKQEVERCIKPGGSSYESLDKLSEFITNTF
ncbi:hypothetical protein ACFE04_011571 [Oxalis oulophora]